jgi:GTP-binding protein YchF
MKLGIIGLPQSGKSTIFEALTGARGMDHQAKGSPHEPRIGTVKMSDERLQDLSRIYAPQKTTFAQVEYLLPPRGASGASEKGESKILNLVRDCDALIHVIKNFLGLDGLQPEPERDYWRLEEELIIQDLVVAEKRLERIEHDQKRGLKAKQEELGLLKRSLELLEQGLPLRSEPELILAPELKGFAFLSAKPQLVLVNNDDEDLDVPGWVKSPLHTEVQVIRGRIEMEIAAMPPEEAEAFLSEYAIEETALDRVIQTSYRLLNRISFFTIGSDEVKAWTINGGTPALEAAGAVHSDMQKGFIRAEVLAYDDLKKYGSFQEAKKVGQVRLEGKEYTVRDGDIINFRFNV